MPKEQSAWEADDAPIQSGGEGRRGADGAGVARRVGHRAGTVQRVARQLGYGVESVRMWVRQADIDDG